MIIVPEYVNVNWHPEGDVVRYSLSCSQSNQQ
jgi:hypothetical protein